MTDQPNARRLDGLRILVVEDMLHLAWETCDELGAAGAVIVGPAGRLDAAVQLAAGEPLDAAVLDVALGGASAAPIAEILAERRIPYVLVSGYGVEQLPPALEGAPLMAKPVAYPNLIEALLEAMERVPES